MMDERRFWRIIGQSRKQALARRIPKGKDVLDVQIDKLTQILRALPPEKIVAYDRRFGYYVDLAYRWDLWGAAYWLYGGCGDDGFLDFRSTIISLGKRRFFAILADPDCLARLVKRPDVPYLQTEAFQYVAMRVYEEKTGEMMPMPEVKRPWPREPKGRRFNFDNEAVMRRRYPKIVARFPEMGG
jgi:hypothetical protein